tara:strand:- start:229 stop:1020 length:792 start_codon:yes stop_codon:yes gene_type:complete
MTFSCPKCSIHYSYDRKPVLLNCGHGCCITCVVSAAATTTSSCIGTICPTCTRKSSYYVNYDLYNHIKANPRNPVLSTLTHSIQELINHISTETTKYGNIKQKKEELEKQILLLEMNKKELYSKMKEEVSNEVHQEKLATAKQIIDNARVKACQKSKQILDQTHLEVLTLQQETILQEKKLLTTKKSFDDHMLMENMIRQHKRNFVLQYSDMMNVIQDFQSIIRQIDSQGNYKSNSTSAKKEIQKSINKILEWEISRFMNKLN